MINSCLRGSLCRTRKNGQPVGVGPFSRIKVVGHEL